MAALIPRRRLVLGVSLLLLAVSVAAVASPKQKKVGAGRVYILGRVGRDARGFPPLPPTPAAPGGSPLVVEERVFPWRLWFGGTGGRVWPAAGALCRYLARTDAARGRTVVEVGCGTGAVGAFVAQALGPTSVLLTDRRNLDLAKRNAASSPLVEVRSLAWGDEIAAATIVGARGPPDLVLGSDVTYARRQHSNLAATLVALGPPRKVLLAHQARDPAQLAALAAALEAADHFEPLRVVHTDISDDAKRPVLILELRPLRRPAAATVLQ